uniref:Uracil phosphoribosyltransferase n=1 Tax=Inkyuleea mariana TaxID=123988 RepID=A0A4D6WZK5_9FLOR|nr:Uracil phosphoribosyltransferase [Inkyuleea mariana]
MQLNIYIISHPIIKILSNTIISSALNTYNKFSSQTHKYIGLLLVYEVLRKWMQIKNLYIKKINYIKEVHIIDSQESYLIITNLLHTYNIITEIKILLPDTELQHIDLNNNKSFTDDYNNIKLINIESTKKIMIIEKFLDNYKIIDLIKYLQVEKNVKIHQIKIISVTCNTKILEKIGQMYPNLNIYTTKLINN